MVRYWFFEDRSEPLYSKCVQGALAVDQGLEILHFGDTFEDLGQAVAREATVIEEHPVDDCGVEVLAGVSQALTVTIT